MLSTISVLAGCLKSTWELAGSAVVYGSIVNVMYLLIIRNLVSEDEREELLAEQMSIVA